MVLLCVCFILFVFPGLFTFRLPCPPLPPCATIHFFLLLELVVLEASIDALKSFVQLETDAKRQAELQRLRTRRLGKTVNR